MDRRSKSVTAGCALVQKNLAEAGQLALGEAVKATLFAPPGTLIPVNAADLLAKYRVILSY
jgi:hypothetical protein